MANKLTKYFQLHRRYFRSINLERDLEKSDALQGYILTERSSGALERILTSLTQPDSHPAHTLTSVYGTGKSAFAHYLACVCAPQQSKLFQSAQAIAHEVLGKDNPVAQAITALPKKGLLTAVATGQGEPLTWTIARALAEGAQRFWKGKRKPDILMTLVDWQCEIEDGQCEITNAELLQALKTVRDAAKTDMVLILDELGKNLEFAARNRGKEDLYLLQQIAELKPSKDQRRIHFLGILHQSFRGYSDRLSGNEQNEWNKIQGRFEDIPFQDSPSQMTRLIGRAIDRSDAEPIICGVNNIAQEWTASLQALLMEQDLPTQALANIYPLHPIAALVLPMLCVRYAQNDRSLFTFLTSEEPYGLQEFLATTELEKATLPTLKLHQIYDYFVESVTGLASRFNLQRWVEIQGLIQDARNCEPAQILVLKTIGILNLVTSTSTLRATPELVAWALCDRPDPSEKDYWQQIITQLQKRGLITYRKQADELRIWQGSDFNVELAIEERLQAERPYLADLLSAIAPCKPLIAQRHYSQTGTPRYFERCYVDSRADLGILDCTVASHDGLIVYWMSSEAPGKIPAWTMDDKPLVFITTGLRELLQSRAQELEALIHIQKTAPELQTDGVARREVRQRLVAAERCFRETMMQAFDWSTGKNSCWITGESVIIQQARAFQAHLSDLCDRVYSQGIRLDNEFINRQVLTSQGAKARRILIEAMLETEDQPRLGFDGYGPEVAIYYSVLKATDIHRKTEDGWAFCPPPEQSGLWTLWAAVEAFCLGAKTAQKSLDQLYQTLNAPPYGLKEGVIPVVLAAVLLHHSDDLGLYKDGTFIPVLGPEHFELLVKEPARFSVKYFEIAGLRLSVFRDLEKMLRSPKAKPSEGVRNPSLLMVAKPLFSFAKKLPKFTRQTQRISPEAQAVLKELQNAQEPDELLFTALPQACGFAAIEPQELEDDHDVAEAFGKKFRDCLQEIYQAYDVLLADAKTRLYQAFGIRSEVTKLREDLRVRATYLLNACIEPLLNRFVRAAVDVNKSDAEWLEAVVMVVSDKPPRSWTDRDITSYELALKDISQRFKHLEVLQRTQELENPDAEPYLLTATRSSGQEVSRVAWVERADEHEIDRFVEHVLEDEFFDKNSQRKEAFLAKLSNKLLGADAQLGQDELKQAKRKRRAKGSHGQVS